MISYLKQKNKNQSLIYSKLENNFHLSNKKALFLNISNYYLSIGYDPFDVAIPLTFHIKSQNDPDFKNFEEVFNKFKQKKQSNIWIIKPGENSNRGCGIQVADQLQEIKNIILQISRGEKTAIV